MSPGDLHGYQNVIIYKNNIIVGILVCTHKKGGFVINIVFDEITANILGKQDSHEFNDSVGNIVCLGSVLDIGPISDVNLWQKRMEYFKKNEVNPKTCALEVQFQRIIEDYNTIERCLNQGKEICVWHCNMAFSICSLALLCHMAKESKSEIFIVKCPEEIGNGGGSYTPLFHYVHWGLMTSAQCRSFASAKTCLPIEDRNSYANLWAKLLHENSNLRLLRGDAVISVEDSYFDPVVFEVMDEKAITDNERYIHALEKAGEYIHQEWFFKRLSVCRSSKH